ncbi:Fc receptor-like protein 5 isoform X2 [Carcharodon carcharias]|uniref:Fc receptor-like protein 5 isoform X2 n=1 Tax=Carcharodon carcharias TaxID=13397 RepID=UPI001B7E52AD|nr:Fc receptor-like protein 5 isoform X2 [Carcharodon carcharias]
MATGVSLLIFVACVVQWTVSQYSLSKPVITLDQRTGVYVLGEMVTITCSVTGENRSKTFYFYRWHQVFSHPQIITRKNVIIFHATAVKNGDQFSCKYYVTVKGRRVDSLESQHVMVTITEPLGKPVITLDQSTGVYVVGEEVTLICTVWGDDREKTFNFSKADAWQHPRQLDMNSGTFPVRGRSNEGRYQCQYKISIRGRHLTSPKSEALTVTITDPLTIPVISLDQTTGVYAVGETITMTCTVTGDNREKMFYFYKVSQRLDTRQITSKANMLTFPNTSLNHGGQYQCKYKITVQSRQFSSKKSEAATVTIAELPEPFISVDSSAVVLRGAVTFNCTNPGDIPAIAFYLHRQGDATHCDVMSAAAGVNSATFTIWKIDRSKIGNYTCRYEALITGRNLSSALSDPVHITVTEQEHVPMAVCIGFAMGVILLLALLGVCLWRKGRMQNNRETRNVVPSGDQNREGITYADIILKTKPKRDCQHLRDTSQAQSEESTLYAEVKL